MKFKKPADKAGFLLYADLVGHTCIIFDLPLNMG